MGDDRKTHLRRAAWCRQLAETLADRKFAASLIKLAEEHKQEAESANDDPPDEQGPP